MVPLARRAQPGGYLPGQGWPVAAVRPGQPRREVGPGRVALGAAMEALRNSSRGRCPLRFGMAKPRPVGAGAPAGPAGVDSQGVVAPGPRQPGPATAVQLSGARKPAAAGGREPGAMSRAAAGPRARQAAQAIRVWPDAYRGRPRRHPGPLSPLRLVLSKWSYQKAPCSQPPTRIFFLCDVRGTPSSRNA